MALGAASAAKFAEIGEPVGLPVSGHKSDRTTETAINNPPVGAIGAAAATAALVRHKEAPTLRPSLPPHTHTHTLTNTHTHTHTRARARVGQRRTHSLHKEEQHKHARAHRTRRRPESLFNPRRRRTGDGRWGAGANESERGVIRNGSTRDARDWRRRRSLTD